MRSVIGGAGASSGSIAAGISIGSVTIGGDLVRPEGFFDSGNITAGKLGSVTIKGSLDGGLIASASTLGAVKISGDATGLVAARGNLNPLTTAAALAIKSVTVGGSAAEFGVIAGLDYTGLLGVPNADVQIGAITIGGNTAGFIAAAGVDVGPDLYYGTADDLSFPGGNAIVSRIASITIRGLAEGTHAGSSVFGLTDRWGIVAQQIGKITTGTGTIPLTAARDAGFLRIGTMGDFFAHEVA